MSMSQEEIEALMNGADDVALDTDDSVDSDISIDDIEDPAEDVSDEDFGDILANIDGIEEDSEEDTSDSSASPDIEELIDNNQYPLPVKKENKVVNQLTEVADDTEEKASQIFDVLSFILDENNEIQSYSDKMGDFIEKQTELLESLSQKFPNVALFSENLELAKELSETSKQLSAKVDGENTKVFEAMELMQFHDINRQKIERVMAVIKKLSNYLNGIFEDDSDRAEVQIAKHISGDSNEVVNEDDLESLISEFSSQE